MLIMVAICKGIESFLGNYAPMCVLHNPMDIRIHRENASIDIGIIAKSVDAKLKLVYCMKHRKFITPHCWQNQVKIKFEWKKEQTYFGLQS